MIIIVCVHIGLSASGGLLPPPASTVRPINPPPGSQGPWNTPPHQQQQPKQLGDEWGDFASFRYAIKLLGEITYPVTLGPEGDPITAAMNQS